MLGCIVKNKTKNFLTPNQRFCVKNWKFTKIFVPFRVLVVILYLAQEIKSIHYQILCTLSKKWDSV